MKMKVLPVRSRDGENFFDPELIQYEFRHKIDTRLSILRNQLKVTRSRGNSLTSKKIKPKNIQTKPPPPQSTGNDSTLFNEDFTAADLLPYIDTAMKLQQNSYEVVMATNRAYDLQILLIFLEAFISFIFNFYYMIAVVAEPQRFKLPQGESIGYLSQHLIQPCICVIITVVGFTKIQAQFKKSSKIVNKIIIYAENDYVRSRFLAFSQQIQTNLPDFTVFGFFSLDGSVLFSMISATTTYLIILVQTLGGDSDDNNDLSLSATMAPTE